MFCYWIKSFAIYVSSFVSLSFLESNRNAIEKQKIKVSKQQNRYSSIIILALFLVWHHFQYLDHDEITSAQGQIRGKTFFQVFYQVKFFKSWHDPINLEISCQGSFKNYVDKRVVHKMSICVNVYGKECLSELRSL